MSGKRRRSLSEDAHVSQAVAEATAAATAAAEAKAAAAATATAAKRESDHFECSICVGLLDNPVTTPCGHNFCKHCLSTWLATKPQCPLCKAAVPAALPLAVNKVLEAAIEANAGPLFLKTVQTRRFLDKLVALDPVGALAELDATVDVTRFVGDAAARMTPLLWACANAKGANVVSWIALAKALIARPGTDLNVQAGPAGGRSAMYYAATTCSIASMSALIPLLFNKGVRDENALLCMLNFVWTICDMTKVSMAPLLSALLLLAKDDSILEFSQADRSHLLCNALKNGLDDVSVALIEKGFRTAPVSDALHFAAAGGCAASIMLLCKTQAPIVSVDEVFHKEQTALHIACSFGRAAAALALLECGTTTFRNHDSYLMSPMLWCVWRLQHSRVTPN